MLYKIIATVFFIGYIPFAPGTFGSAFALALLLLLKPSHEAVFAMLILSFMLGIFSAHRLEKQIGKSDPSCVVIDEFAGYLTSVLWIPLTIQNLLIAFVLFRFFDILKPPPIRQIEKLASGGFAIMIDDVIAGAITNILMRIFN
ncbi:phosphatidylglycerophosphatase A family protein [Thermodesulfovibrio hydrogeniphilus]